MILSHPTAFFNKLRKHMFGPTLEQSELDGCYALIAACQTWPLAWEAYGFSTAYHETAHTMQPVREIGGAAYFTRMYDPAGLRPEVAQRLGNTHPGDGARFPGMGYVQSTGRGNARKITAALHAAGSPATSTWNRRPSC
jgi:putative chitinase